MSRAAAPPNATEATKLISNPLELITVNHETNIARPDIATAMLVSVEVISLAFVSPARPIASACAPPPASCAIARRARRHRAGPCRARLSPARTQLMDGAVGVGRHLLK